MTKKIDQLNTATFDAVTEGLTTFGGVTFDLNSPFASLIPQFRTIVGQIKDIDTTLAGLAGTHAARKADALAKLTSIDLEARAEASDAFDSIPVGPVEALTWAQQVYDAAKLDLEEAKAGLDEAITAALRADKSANTTDRDAHLATRETLVTSAAAMATLIAGATKPLTASDLGIAKAKGGGGTSTPRTAKVGQGVFSYRRAGDTEFTVPCDAQQALSSIAYRVFDKAPVGVLRAALAEANGGPVDETKPFSLEVKVNDKVATVSFDVTEAAPATEG